MANTSLQWLFCLPWARTTEFGFSIGTWKRGSTGLGTQLHCRVPIPRFSPSHWSLAGPVPLLPFGLRLWLNATPHTRHAQSNHGKAFTHMLGEDSYVIARNRCDGFAFQGVIKSDEFDFLVLAAIQTYIFKHNTHPSSSLSKWHERL